MKLMVSYVIQGEHQHQYDSQISGNEPVRSIIFTRTPSIGCGIGNCMVGSAKAKKSK